MNEKMKTECIAAVEEMIETITFYFNEHPENRHEWAQAFKVTFCELVDKMEEEFRKNEDEEDF